MPKPSKRAPSEGMRHFTDRGDLLAIFQRNLASATEPPVLVFYGIGGAGKSWLLRNLLEQVPPDIPKAILDFDRTAGGRGITTDPAAAIYEIRKQLDLPAPRFDLAYGALLNRQGVNKETSFLTDLVAELFGILVPGGETTLKRLSRPLLSRLKGTHLEEFLARKSGQEFALGLRRNTSQEIGAELISYLAEDLRACIPIHLNRAVFVAIFFDTFEAVSPEAESEQHRLDDEEWIRDVAFNFDFALTVIAGQNRLTWDEIDPDWSMHLDQHLVGGLSESDARKFLNDCEIRSELLQDVILATTREEDGGHHCFSLGLCADIVDQEHSRGIETSPESLRIAPREREYLAHRFLNSLRPKEEHWIKKLALTPRFDEKAARTAFSAAYSADQDAAWEALPRYSFVDRVVGNETWLFIRAQMRRTLENQPCAKGRVSRDHAWWQQYWDGQSASPVDSEASLAWYHKYCTSPKNALESWERLAQAARTSIPPRMNEHFDLLKWWGPVNLLAALSGARVDAEALVSLGCELYHSSVGNRNLNLRRSIECYEASARVQTESDFPKEWAKIQNCLGLAWSELPTADRTKNLKRSISFYEAALRVYRKQDSSRDWADVQNNLGEAWSSMPTGNRNANLLRAKKYFEEALTVRTVEDLSREWAETQNNLGIVWNDLPTGNRGENLHRAIEHYEAALRVYEEQNFPQEWAMTQNNLGAAWDDLPTGDRTENIQHAMEHYENALRIYSEQDFPQDWAMTQNNLGAAWNDLQAGDRDANLKQAMKHYESALRIYTEQDFPQDWAMIQGNLGEAWASIPTGKREENLCNAIKYYNAALSIYREQDFPQEWAMIQGKLGEAWADIPNANKEENLHNAIKYYSAALSVYKESDFPQEHQKIGTALQRACVELSTIEIEPSFRLTRGD